MNRQPYMSPPRWWPPRLSRRWVRLTRGYRRRQLVVGQRIEAVDVEDGHHLVDAVGRGHGVLIVPNHSTHFDSNALYLAADSLDLPLYFMTAWQVFHACAWWERWAMQRVGCFSIDRESNDRQAFKQAVDVLRHERCPLVIFPEGDIYHTSDRVMPFREGAAAIATAAVKRSTRPITALACAIRFRYVEDPTAELTMALNRIEERLYLRNANGMQLAVRVHRVAEAALALKELDYVGYSREGRVRDRIAQLSNDVLTRLEQRHNMLPREKAVPQRVKTIRQLVIRKLERPEPPESLTITEDGLLRADMEDLFFVMQLFSYPGDYLLDAPRIERLAETIDKLEEDVLGLDAPHVRGRRRVTIRFGAPHQVDPASGREVTPELTRFWQTQVQRLLDEMQLP